MHFRTLDVPVPLRRHVLACWVADSGGEDDRTRTFQAVADGSPGLVVRLDGGAPIVAPGHGALPEAMVYGQATLSRQLVSEGRFHAFGVVFRPDALHTVFGVRADALTDGCTDLRDLVPKAALAGLNDHSEQASPEQVMQRIAASLARSIADRGRALDPVIAAALDRVDACAGAIAPLELRNALGISERGLQRRFEQHVGIPPRTYLRLVRFQASLRSMDHALPERLSDLAYDADYADQSHHIRTFREFVGVTPGQFAAQARPVAANFVEVGA